MKINDIIEPLAELYTKHRKDCINVSEFTKGAQKITKEWQKKFSNNPNIKSEVSIIGKSKFKIDMIDYNNTITAYELKVSGNNPHHEFYKDIFKVIAYNKHCEEGERIKKLVFLTELLGKVRLETSDLGQEIIESGSFDFDIKIETINKDIGLLTEDLFYSLTDMTLFKKLKAGINIVHNVDFRFQYDLDKFNSYKPTLSFKDEKSNIEFLSKEKELAIKFQEFEKAAYYSKLIDSKQLSVNDFYLNYRTIDEKTVMFNTNSLIFKYDVTGK